MVLNKVDLAPYIDFDDGAFLADARKVNPGVELLRVSAISGAGMSEWYAWLGSRGE